jgi:hypothetical protein
MHLNLASSTVASVKVRTSPVMRASPCVIFMPSLRGGTQLSDHHPGSVRCFRTVPSVVQCRVMSNEEASGVNFPAIWLQISHCAAGAQQ